jgi:CopA family copper-resistance protein
MLSRRQLLQNTAWGGLAFGAAGLVPAWALPSTEGNLGITSLTGTDFDLSVGKFPVRINGRATQAIGVNGSLPAPLIRFREGDNITLNVRNGLDVDSSIHWHGLLVPFQMDGVPGVTFPGIKPGETFKYEFAVPQSGTYWYHSHSGLQEQVGHYGPMIIDPKDEDPVEYEREYVLMLGDWTYDNPHHLFAKLKKNAESLNFNQPTMGEFLADARENGLGAAMSERAMWGAMRMSPRDIADVTGATYTYVINGHATADNWNALYRPGERIRLRIINAAAMTLFNVRIPGLTMTIVNADGLNVQPLEVDEFQMGVAETYDVIIEPKEDRAYAFVAESIDRSGQVVASIAPRPGMRASEPALRAVPTLTMKDMGMDHSGMGSMDHGSMDHGEMDHGQMAGSMMDHEGMDHMMEPNVVEASIERGPGVANVAAMPISRLDEPGIGLEDVAHRTLRYSQLRSLDPNPDTRAPGREVVVHLTSNMERYMWSFDGVKFSEVTKPIIFHEGERVRLTMVNNTMMPHPIHLHGMFFDVVNGGGDHKPRKHTITVKPGERLSVDISADHVGDWAFHCHLMYHMHAGMMQVVSVMPRDGSHTPMMDHEGMDHGDMDHGDMDHGDMDHGEMDHGSMKHGEDE